MAALLFRREVETLARHQGLRPQDVGQVLTLGCHPDAGCLVHVLKEDQGRACTTIVRLLCWSCHTPIVDLAIREPVLTPRRCMHHRGALVAYGRGHVLLLCPACDRLWVDATLERKGR